jgi:poly(A) polymerase
VDSGRASIAAGISSSLCVSWDSSLAAELDSRPPATKYPPMTAHDAACYFANALVAAGYEAVFAGGCVRDKLLGREAKDYDLATSATPQQVLRLFPKSNEVGAHFGVVIAKHAGEHVEIASFRTDGSYKDGRRPTAVTFASAEEDAQRRDFTLNGLFENPVTGEVIDYVGGLADLKAGVLRAIGDPRQRFSEDSLRLLRAVRFATVLSLKIEPKTLEAMHECAGLLARISPERIRDEFSKIIQAPRRRQGLELLVTTGLIRYIIPEVLDLIGCEQPPEWHPEGDVYTHTGIMLEMIADDAPLELCLAVLLHDIAKPPCQTFDAENQRIRFNGHDAMGATMAETILRRLRYSNDTIATVVPLVARHMQFMNVQQMRIAKLKCFMAAPHFAQEMELHRVDCASSNGFSDNYEFLQQKALEFAAEPLIPAPFVSGRDLIALGMSPGPCFKQLLEQLQTEQLEGRILDRQAAMDYLQAHARKISS